jgi:HK97 family phage major capsid protein
VTGDQLAAQATVAVKASTEQWFEGDDLIRLYFAMDYWYRQRGGCVWVMHPATMAQIIRIKRGDGGYVYGDLADAPPTALLGCPVREEVTMPRSGPGKRSVVFADFGTTTGAEPMGPVLCLEHPE